MLAYLTTALLSVPLLLPSLNFPERDPVAGGLTEGWGGGQKNKTKSNKTKQKTTPTNPARANTERRLKQREGHFSTLEREGPRSGVREKPGLLSPHQVWAPLS